MATLAQMSTMFDLILVPILWISVMCVAVWNRNEFSENAYRWMEVDFIAGILIRLWGIVDHCLANRVGFVFAGQPMDVRYIGRIVLVVQFALGVVLYPFLLAWSIYGVVLFTRGKDLLPEGGLKWCFFMLWLLNYVELFFSFDSCVAKGRELLNPARISLTRLRHNLLADSEQSSVVDQVSTGIVEP